MERSNLEAVVARSSSGVLQQVVDVIRIRIVKIDMFVHRLSRCACNQKQIYLPPKPIPKDTSSGIGGGGSNGRPGLQKNVGASRKMATRIVEVQGAYSGVVSKGLGWLIDEALAISSFALAAMFMEGVTRFIKDQPDFEIDAVLMAIAYFGWSYTYKTTCLLVSCRTVGMMLMGLLTVNTNGGRPGVLQIMIQQVLELCQSGFPVAGLVGFLIGWFRADGRFPHELLTCTGTVFSWDVRMAKLRLSGKPMGQVFGDDNDDDDEDCGYKGGPLDP